MWRCEREVNGKLEERYPSRETAINECPGKT